MITKEKARTKTQGVETDCYIELELYEDIKNFNENVDVYAFSIIMLFVFT